MIGHIYITSIMVNSNFTWVIAYSEYVNARKFYNMTKELIIKASLYNMFVAMRM